MLLRRVEIENFRGLRSAVLDFDPTTALIGENSAGKTTPVSYTHLTLPTIYSV